MGIKLRSRVVYREIALMRWQSELPGEEGWENLSWENWTGVDKFVRL